MKWQENVARAVMLVGAALTIIGIKTHFNATLGFLPLSVPPGVCVAAGVLVFAFGLFLLRASRK